MQQIINLSLKYKITSWFDEYVQNIFHVTYTSQDTIHVHVKGLVQGIVWDPFHQSFMSS